MNSSLKLPAEDSPVTESAAHTSRVNALSSRIASVLSLSYVDSTVDLALQTLDSDASRSDLSKIRQHFRQDVQRQVIDENVKVVQDFALVSEQLRRVGQSVRDIQQICIKARRNLEISRTTMGPSLQDSRQLLQQLDSVRRKQMLLEATRQHFTAPPPVPNSATKGAISSSAELGDEFFAHLAKLVEIHRDSQILLGADDQQLGLDILDTTSTQLNSAYETLYHSIVKQWRNLDLENPRISFSVRRSLLALAARPSLFKSCLDAYADVRSRILTDSFFMALTGTGLAHDGRQRHSLDGGLLSPTHAAIDLSDHDPVRHTSDMLAWVHSTAVSESETLSSVFFHDRDEITRDMREGRKNEPWNLGEDGETFDPQATIRDLVDRSLGGAAYFLKQRVEKAFKGEDVLTMMKLHNLASFYTDTLVKLVGDRKNGTVGASMMATFFELERAIGTQFEASLRELARSIPGRKNTVDMSRDAEGRNGQKEEGKEEEEGDEEDEEYGAIFTLDPHTCQPPLFLNTILSTIVQLLSTAEKSYVSTARQGGQSPSTFFTIVHHEILTPALEACRRVADSTRAAATSSARSHIPTVFLLNSFLAFRSKLSSFAVAAGFLREINTRISHLCLELELDQHQFLCGQSGLAELFALAESATHAPAPVSSSHSHFQGEGADSRPGPSSSTTDRNGGGGSARAGAVNASSNSVTAAAGSSKPTLHMSLHSLRSAPLLSPKSLSARAYRFDAFLPSALPDAKDRIRMLSDPTMAQEVTEGAARRFCGQFARLEWLLELLDDNGGPGDGGGRGVEDLIHSGSGKVKLRDLFVRTSEEVRVLLS